MWWITFWRWPCQPWRKAGRQAALSPSCGIRATQENQKDNSPPCFLGSSQKCLSWETPCCLWVATTVTWRKKKWNLHVKFALVDFLTSFQLASNFQLARKYARWKIKLITWGIHIRKDKGMCAKDENLKLAMLIRLGEKKLYPTLSGAVTHSFKDMMPKVSD